MLAVSPHHRLTKLNSPRRCCLGRRQPVRIRGGSGPSPIPGPVQGAQPAGRRRTTLLASGCQAGASGSVRDPESSAPSPRSARPRTRAQRTASYSLAVPSRAQPSAATRAKCREPSWASDRSRSRKRHRNRAAPSSLRYRRRWIAMLVFTFLWFSKAKLTFPAAICQIFRALKLENGDLLAPCNVQHAAFFF
jgi:hypothetical protein